jgi:hypothetical protein
VTSHTCAVPLPLLAPPKQTPMSQDCDGGRATFEIADGSDVYSLV